MKPLNDKEEKTIEDVIKDKKQAIYRCKDCKRLVSTLVITDEDICEYCKWMRENRK